MKNQYTTLTLLTAVAAVIFFSIWPPRTAPAQSASQIDVAVQQVNPQAGGSVPYAVTSMALIDTSGKVSVQASANALVLEGATRNDYQTTLAVEEPVRDATVTVANRTGTVVPAQSAFATAVTADNQAVIPGTQTYLTFTSDDATPANRTITLTTTGAVTGQIYVLVGPATNAIQLADSGNATLSAAWEPDANDSLTLLYTGSVFLELARSAN